MTYKCVVCGVYCVLGCKASSSLSKACSSGFVCSKCAVQLVGVGFRFEGAV